MGKSKFHKSEKAARTLSFFQSSNTAAPSKVTPETNFLQDATVARQLLSTNVWKDDFQSLIDQLDALKTGDDVSCLAALNKLTANKALIATVAAVESLTEQLASELHNLVLARSSSKRGKREATGSNRKKKYVSTEASSPVSNGVQPREKTVNPVASDVPVPICKQENETALSAEVKQCPEEEKVDDGMGPPASFSSAREASSEDFSETEASASKDKPLNRLLKRHGCTTAKMQTICEQTVMELVSQPVAMPGILVPSPGLRLLGSTKALALVSAPDSLEIAPIFIASRRRADVAHLNLTVPWMLGDKKHVVLITVEPSDEAAYRKWAEHSDRHILVVLPEDGCGIGYARRWIQDVAARLKLRRYWQMDDNVCAIRDQDEIIPAHGIMELLQGLEPRSVISVVHPTCKIFIWYPMVLLYTPLQSPRFKARFNERERVADAEWVDFTEQVQAIDGPLIHDKTPCWLVMYQPGYPGGWGVPDVNGESALPVHKYESREEVALGAKMWYTRSCFFGTGHFDREAIQKAVPSPVLQAVYALLDVLVTVCHEIWVEGRYQTLVPWPLHPLVEASLKLNGQRWPSHAVHNLLEIFKSLREVAAKDAALLKWWSEVGWRLLDGSEKWQTKKSSRAVPTKEKATPQSKASPSPEKTGAAAASPGDPGAEKTQTAADKAERAAPPREAKGTPKNPEEKQQTGAGAEGGLEKEGAGGMAGGSKAERADSQSKAGPGSAVKRSEDAVLAVVKAPRKARRKARSGSDVQLAKPESHDVGIAKVKEAGQKSVTASPPAESDSVDGVKLVTEEAVSEGKELAEVRAVEKAVEHPAGSTSGVLSESTIVGAVEACQPSAAATELLLRSTKDVAEIVINFLDSEGYVLASQNNTRRSTVCDSVVRMLFKLSSAATSSGLYTKLLLTVSRYAVNILYDKRLLLQYCKEIASRAGHLERLYLSSLISYVGIAAVRDWREVIIQRATTQALSKLVSFATEDDGIHALPAVMGAMAAHPRDVQVQYLGFSFLADLAEKAPSNRWLMAVLGAASSAATAMGLGRSNESMQKKGCRLIRVLADSLQSDAEPIDAEKDAAKTKHEDTVKNVMAAARTLLPQHRLEALESALKALPRPRFIGTFKEVFSALRDSLTSSPSSSENVKKDCLKKLMAYTSSEAAELMLSCSSEYASQWVAGQVELAPWHEAVSAVLQALEAFPQSRAVQKEGLAALAELLQGPSFAAVCDTFQIHRGSNRESAAQCFMLDDLRTVLVKVAVNFRQDLQLLQLSVRLLRQLFEDHVPRFVPFPVISTSIYQESPQSKSPPFFVSTYVPTTSHTEWLPRLGPRFAPWITSFDSTACSVSTPSHPLWTDSFLEFPQSLLTRPLSHYWNEHRAGLKSKQEDGSQPATAPEAPVLFSKVSQAEAYFGSESFAIALHSMQPESRGTALELVKLTKSLVAAIAALEAVSVPRSEVAKDAVNEEDQQTEPVVEHACILLDATERLLSNATHWLKHALSRAAAASEKAAGNESAHKRWQSFVDAMEAGRVKHQEGKDELCQSERASEEGSPSNDEGQVRPEEIESVTWESQAGTKGPAKQLKGVFSRGSTGGQKSPGEDRKAHTVSPEEESQLNEQAAALVSSLASLCQLPVVLRKAVQALRPLLKIARPVSALESAAFALSSMYLAWGRLEPALVGEMLIDRPWFAAFVPPRREKLLSVSWRESGILELFEILEFRAETAEKWTATPEDLRHQVGIAVHAWASLSSTFSVDALELLALEGLPHVPSGVAAGLRVMLCEPDPEARQMWTEAIRLLAERYPRALSRGFAGTSLQELDSYLTVLRALTQPDAAAGRSCDVFWDFLDVVRTRRSDIHRLVKKLKRGSKQGAKDLRDLTPESPADVPLMLLRLRSEKLWERGLSGEGRLEELFPVEEVASRLFEAVQKAAVRRAGGDGAATGGNPEKAVEQLLSAGASGTSATSREDSQPNPPSAETPTKFSPGSRAGGQGTPLQPLFDSWAQPVNWDAAFETMVMKCREEAKCGPPLGLLRTCLLECMDSEALVFARELIQKLADEPSPSRNLRALSQLFAVVGHGARDRPESAAVFIASGLVSEIGITMTRFAPGGDGFSKRDELEGAEERLGDLQRDGCFALSAMLSKAAAERESAEAGDRRVLTQLLESCEDATFEVLQSAYRKYTPAELPEGAAEAGVSTPPERVNLGQSEKVRSRKDVRDAARMGLLKLRALLPETSPKSKAISGFCLAHDAIVADQAEAMALVTRADCLLEDGFGRVAAWYRDFWKRDWVLPSDEPKTDPEPPSTAVAEPGKAAATELQSLPSGESASVPGLKTAVEATAEHAGVEGSGERPLTPSAPKPEVSAGVGGVSGARQDADAGGSIEQSEPQQEEDSQERSLPSEPKEVPAAQAEGSDSVAVKEGADPGDEGKGSGAETKENPQVASVGLPETSPGLLEAEARSAGAAGGGGASPPGKKASKKKKKKKQSRQAAVGSEESQLKPSEGSNMTSQPGAAEVQAEAPKGLEAASLSDVQESSQLVLSPEVKREESCGLPRGAPGTGAEEAPVSPGLPEAAPAEEQPRSPTSPRALCSKMVTDLQSSMDRMAGLLSRWPLTPAESSPQEPSVEPPSWGLRTKLVSFVMRCQELKEGRYARFVPASDASLGAVTVAKRRPKVEREGESLYGSQSEGLDSQTSFEVTRSLLGEGDKLLEEVQHFIRSSAEGEMEGPLGPEKGSGGSSGGGSLRQGEKEPEVTQGSAEGSASGLEEKYGGKKTPTASLQEQAAIAGVETVPESEEAGGTEGGASTADDASETALFDFGAASESVGRAQKERVRKRRADKEKKGAAEEGEERSVVRVLRSRDCSVQLRFKARGKHFVMQPRLGGKKQAGPARRSCALLEELTGQGWTIPQNITSVLVTVTSEGGAGGGSETYLWKPEDARAGRAESLRKVSGEDTEALEGAGSDGQAPREETTKRGVGIDGAASSGGDKAAGHGTAGGNDLGKKEEGAMGSGVGVAAVAGALERVGVEMLQAAVFPLNADKEEASVGKDGKEAEDPARGEEPSLLFKGDRGTTVPVGGEGKKAGASGTLKGEKTASDEGKGLVGSDEPQANSVLIETGTDPGAELTHCRSGGWGKESDGAVAGGMGATSRIRSSIAESYQDSSFEPEIEGVAPKAVGDPLRMSEPAPSTSQSEEDIGEPEEPEEFAALLGMLKGEDNAGVKPSLPEEGASEKLESKGPLFAGSERPAEKGLPVLVTEEVTTVATVLTGSASLVGESHGGEVCADVGSERAEARPGAEERELGQSVRSVPGGLSGAADSNFDLLKDPAEAERIVPGAGDLGEPEVQAGVPDGEGEPEKGELEGVAAGLLKAVSNEANGREETTADLLKIGEVNGVPETAARLPGEESGEASGGAETAAESQEAMADFGEAKTGPESTAELPDENAEGGKRRAGEAPGLLKQESAETTGAQGTAAKVLEVEGGGVEIAAGLTNTEPEPERANWGRGASEAPSDVPDFVSEPDDEAWFDATDEECDEPSPRVAKGKAELLPEPEGAEGRTSKRTASLEGAGNEPERGEVVKKPVEGMEECRVESVEVGVVENAEGVAPADEVPAQPAGEPRQEAGQGKTERDGVGEETVAAREAGDFAKEEAEGDAEGQVEATEEAEVEGEGDISLSVAGGAVVAEAAGSVGGSRATEESKTESEGGAGAAKEDGEAERAAKGMGISGRVSKGKVEAPMCGDDEKAAADDQENKGLDGEAGRAAELRARGSPKGVQIRGSEERGGADLDVPDFVSDESDEESAEPEEKAESAEATGGLPTEGKANGTEARTLPQGPILSHEVDGRPSAEPTAGILPLPKSSSAGILPLPRSASPGVLPRSSSAASILQRPSPPAVPPAPPVPDDLPDFVSSSSEAESSAEENGDTTAGIRSLSGRLPSQPVPAVGLQKTVSEKRVKEPIPPELGRLGRAGTLRTGERREQAGFTAEVTSPLEQLRQGNYQPPRVRTSFVAQTLNPASPPPPSPLSPPLGPETPASELDEGDFKPGDDDVSDADSEGWVTLGSENGGGHDWRLARDLYGTFPYEAGYRSLATSAESSLSPPKRPLRLSQQATRGAAGVAGGPGSAGREREALAGARLGVGQQLKIRPAISQADIDDGGWIDVAPRKKKGPHPLGPAQDVRFMEAQYFSEALPPAPRVHARKRVRGNKKLAHRQAELRHARVVSGAALLPLPSRNQSHTAGPAALLHPNLGLAAAVPPLPPHPKHAHARPQPPANPQTSVRTKANTGRQYVPVHTTWADIPDPSDSATDTGTPLVGRPSHSPFAAEEPPGGRRTAPDPTYHFPTERLALQAGLPNEITRQEPPSRAAPRQYAPSLHGPSAARPAALGGLVPGHVSDSGRAELPRAARQMAQYFSDVEAAGADPRVVELLSPVADARAFRLQERAAATPQQVPQPHVPAAGRPPRGTQKQRTDTAAPGTAQVGRRSNEPVLVRTESIISDEGAVRPQKAAKRRQAEEEAEDAYCCICFENPKNAALSPCGHLLCVECAEVMHKTRKTCPVCSKKIESVLKLFDSAIRLPSHLR